MELNRRSVLQGALTSAAIMAYPAVLRAQNGGAITLADFIRAPALHHFYSVPPPGHFTSTGYGGVNVGGMRLIEDQRGGADWITRWFVSGKQEWRDFGWHMLDIGAELQQPDGSFGHFGYYHSNSLYLEALARALILDPAGKTEHRLGVLRQGVHWMLAPADSKKGLSQNAPYTHRNYILASMFGEAGYVLGDADYLDTAASFAKTGLGRQQSDGRNPEMGGGDVSYQMAGVFAALRYYPYASAAMQDQLRTMIKAAIAWDLRFIGQDGAVDTGGSTRVGTEKVLGKVKGADLPTIFQTLNYANVIMPNPDWVAAAHSVAVSAKLPV
jgi:hypothetical protein